MGLLDSIKGMFGKGKAPTPDPNAANLPGNPTPDASAPAPVAPPAPPAPEAPATPPSDPTPPAAPPAA